MNVPNIPMVRTLERVVEQIVDVQAVWVVEKTTKIPKITQQDTAPTAEGLMTGPSESLNKFGTHSRHPNDSAEKEIRSRQRSDSMKSSRCSSQKQHIDKMIDVTARLHRQIPCDRKVTGDQARREHSGGQNDQHEGEEKQLLNIQ